MSERTYGSEFIEHLQGLSRQTPYNYSDLQQVKAMTQQQLADWILKDCKKVSEIIVANPAVDAAAIIHKQRTEAAAANADAVQGSLSLVELICHVFSIVH